MRHLLALAFIVAGCSTTKAVVLPNGGSGYMLKCRHPGECEERAMKVCPHGHRIVGGTAGRTQIVECAER